MIKLQEKSIHRIFVISLVLKGINSVLEILGGILFLFTGTVTSILSAFVVGELIEDPNDFVANQIQHLLPYFSTHSQSFGALYLLSHGVIKIFLVVSLLRNKLWAYPVTIVVIILFIVYQIYRLSYAYSPFLVWLTVFDLFVVLLTWHEYNLVRKHIALE